MYYNKNIININNNIIRNIYIYIWFLVFNEIKFKKFIFILKFKKYVFLKIKKIGLI